MKLGSLLERVNRLYPDKIGVVCGEHRFTYREFARRVSRLAACLQHEGIGKGDRVAICHQNCHYFLEAYFAAAVMGAILCPLNYRLSPREIAFILEDTGAVALIGQPKFYSIIKEAIERLDTPVRAYWTEKETVPAGETSLETLLVSGADTPAETEIQEDDVAQLYYTSGTTGRQKGVILTHRNVAYHSLGTIAELKMTDEDVWLHAAPMFHLADAWATWAVTWVGGTHVMVPEFSSGAVIEVMQREKVTLTNMIPTMLNLMVHDPAIQQAAFPSLRLMLSGGAPIAPEVVRKIMDAFGCDYVQTYGMTETSPYLTMSLLKGSLQSRTEEERFRFKAATGRPVLFVDLKVVKEDGREVAWDGKEVGEIVVRGESVTPGYWHLPEETEKGIRNGWLYTGDLAVVDSEGYVNIVDRKKDMIVTGGENVYSTEVENVLYSHPAVLEAAVIGIPDEKWGEAVHACVVLKDGMDVSEKDLIDFCKKDLARYKAPKSVEFLPALPRTGSGKIYKKGLSDKYVRYEE
ncbi:MAG: long-chain-fatty-acid--CoA ligase [Deltaproteobacteria bacterium]|nr:long-chain-fatty-acid--CoA ligase [Deltaproteobacteria bacterium]